MQHPVSLPPWHSPALLPPALSHSLPHTRHPVPLLLLVLLLPLPLHLHLHFPKPSLVLLLPKCPPTTLQDLLIPLLLLPPILLHLLPHLLLLLPRGTSCVILLVTRCAFPATGEVISSARYQLHSPHLLPCPLALATAPGGIPLRGCLPRGRRDGTRRPFS